MAELVCLRTEIGSCRPVAREHSSDARIRGVIHWTPLIAAGLIGISSLVK